MVAVLIFFDESIKNELLHLQIPLFRKFCYLSFKNWIFISNQCCYMTKNSKKYKFFMLHSFFIYTNLYLLFYIAKINYFASIKFSLTEKITLTAFQWNCIDFYFMSRLAMFQFALFTSKSQVVASTFHQRSRTQLKNWDSRSLLVVSPCDVICRSTSP